MSYQNNLKSLARCYLFIISFGAFKKALLNLKPVDYEFLEEVVRIMEKKGSENFEKDKTGNL